VQACVNLVDKKNPVSTLSDYNGHGKHPPGTIAQATEREWLLEILPFDYKAAATPKESSTSRGTELLNFRIDKLERPQNELLIWR
jgi:hypothetical protein